MDESEFDRFADEYRQLHAGNIRASGESPEFFAEYKVADVARLVRNEHANSPGRILDFGAGVGGSVPYFRKHFPHADITCIDVSRKSLAIGRSRFHGDATFVHFDGRQTLLPDDHFDLVFISCVLHHVPSAAHPDVLRELRRVLKPSGRLIIYEHNPYNPLTVRAVNRCPFDANAVLIRARTLRERVQQAGFPVVDTRYRIFFPGWLRALRPLERWMTWLPMGAQYFVHARKTPTPP